MKTLLHQRANRIGKVENRIARLEAALQEVEKNWPGYVHQISQLLASEHQKCLQFHAQALAELSQLRQEMKQLLTQELRQEETQTPIIQPHVTSYASVVQPDVGHHVPHLPISHVGKPMEVDSTQVPSTFHFPLPSVMSHAEASVVPQMPVITPGLNQQNTQASQTPVFNHHAAVAPPGNWTWPPAAPALGFSAFQLPNVSQPTQPVEDTQEHIQPSLNTSAPVLPVQPTAHLPPPLIAPEVQHAINQAAQALIAQQQAATGDMQATLTPEQLEQLHQFGQQQMECHAQLQQLHVASQQQARAPVSHTPQETPVPLTQVSGLEQPGIMSVASSPERPSKMFSASPQNQRQQKIHKNTEGNVHQQVHIGPFARSGPDPVAIPLNDASPIESPRSSRSPTPVPTEIPTPSEIEEAPKGPLQQLE